MSYVYEHRKGFTTAAKITGTAVTALVTYKAVNTSLNALSKLTVASNSAKAFSWKALTAQIRQATNAKITFSAVSKACAGPVALLTAAVVAGTSAFLMFRKRGKEATDTMKKVGEYSKDYYASEKKFLEEHFDKMQKANAKSKERNKLVDELKRQYPGLNEQLEKELRSTNNLNNSKEILISLIKKQAITEGMKQLLTEKSKAVADAELAAYVEEQENKEIRKRNQYLTQNINDQVGAVGTSGGLGAVGSVSKNVNLVPEKTEAKNALNKANKEYNDANNLLKTKEKELLKSLTGIGGNDTSGSGGGTSGYTSTASDSITGGGKQVKNFYINIDSLIKENTNMFQSSKDDPQSSQDFMGKLSDALQKVVNDVNYSAA